jgi:hypothetical protein
VKGWLKKLAAWLLERAADELAKPKPEKIKRPKRNRA